MEMLGLSDRFQGNKATYWGTQNERRAIQKFAMHVNTSQLYHCGFDVLQDVDKYGRMRSWVGASPDGLLLPEAPDGKLQQGNYDDRPVSNLLLDVHDNRMKGVLEVCGFSSTPAITLHETAQLLDVLLVLHTC